MLPELVRKNTGGNFITPLRYPGGKGRLGPWLAALLKYNNSSDGIYVEPYAGGAGAALYLLAKRHVERIIINDLDPAVYAFWWSIINRPSDFMDLFEDTSVDIESWERQRSIQKSPGSFELLEVGFSTFFLNRTNRSGILEGGVIGGKAQNGKYLIDARFNKANLKARLLDVIDLGRKITLYNADAIDIIEGICGDLSANDLIYFDPPYYNKGGQLYRNHYEPDDHYRISHAIRGLSTPWLVTYDSCPEIHELYRDEESVEFSLCYSTHSQRKKSTEIMIYKNISLHEAPTLHR